MLGTLVVWLVWGSTLFVASAKATPKNWVGAARVAQAGRQSSS